MATSIFSLSCGTHDRGGGCANRKFFLLAVNPPSPPGWGNGGQIGLQIFNFPSKPNTYFTFFTFSVFCYIFFKHTLAKKLFWEFSPKKTDLVIFHQKNKVVLKKTQFSMKKTQNPSRSRKTPDLVKKPQEWERCFLGLDRHLGFLDQSQSPIYKKASAIDVTLGCI